MQLLDGIDPNPDNMVCAGIIHTQSHQVGCLLRLEPNKQAQVSMVRTTKQIFKASKWDSTWFRYSKNLFPSFIIFRCSVLRFAPAKSMWRQKSVNYSLISSKPFMTSTSRFLCKKAKTKNLFLLTKRKKKNTQKMMVNRRTIGLRKMLKENSFLIVYTYKWPRWDRRRNFHNNPLQNSNNFMLIE